MTVGAQSSETFDTVATAAVTGDGSAPDKNADAASQADSKTTTATNTNGKTSSSTTGVGGSTTPASSTPSAADKGKGVGVGASFGMVYAGINTIATIGENRNVEAGGFDLHAIAKDKAETFSVAGTDPFVYK